MNSHFPQPGDRVTFRIGGPRRVGKPTTRKVAAVTDDGAVLVRYGGKDRFPIMAHEVLKVESVSHG